MKKTVKLLNGKITDLINDFIRSYFSYIVLVGGVWLLLNTIGFILDPSRGFVNLFNSSKAFCYSLLIFLVMITRQKTGEILASKMNVIISEIIAFVSTIGIAFAVLSVTLKEADERNLISALILFFIRFVFIQIYFDKGLTRRKISCYEEFAKLRRINLLPVISAFIVFFDFATNRHPDIEDSLFLSALLESVVAIIAIIVIKNRTKKMRVLPSFFERTEKIVIDIDLTELSLRAYLHKKELKRAKSDILHLFSGAGYGFSGNTLVSDLDNYLLCRKSLPEVKNKNVLIHIRKDIEKYGANSAELLEKISDAFISKGFVVYLQCQIENKSSYHIRFENRIAEKCVILIKDYYGALQTVINSSDGYNQKCAEHIKALFSPIYSGRNTENTLYKVICSQLKELISEYSLLDMFYELIQTAELCVHLTSLCALSKNVKHDKKAVEQLAIGTMIEITRRCTPNRKVTDEKLKEAVVFIDTLCCSGSKGTVNETRVFSCVSTLRNRYLGHGTMTYSVSEELVYNLAFVCAYITEVCCEVLCEQFGDVDLTAEKIPDTDVKSAVVVENDIYFYSSHIFGDKAEYINPLNGQIYQNCKYRIVPTCRNNRVYRKED